LKGHTLLLEIHHAGQRERWLMAGARLTTRLIKKWAVQVLLP
jgi:hypothetical protein